MTYRPAHDLPASHRPRDPGSMSPCGICGAPTLHSDSRFIRKLPGFEYRKRGIACDPCAERVITRHDRAASRQGRL